MISECWTPQSSHRDTFFSIYLVLTLSCVEYASPDITAYLRKVNHVPSNIGKLCTEDPISVLETFL